MQVPQGSLWEEQDSCLGPAELKVPVRLPGGQDDIPSGERINVGGRQHTNSI